MLQSPMKGEIFNVKAQLESCTAERNLLEEALRKIQYRVKNDTESNLSLQVQNYESRLTELHCIIVELRKQLDYQREHIIPEECTEDEMDNNKEEQVDSRMMEDEYPGLPEPEVLSGDVAFTATTTSASSSSTSPSAGSPDQPTTSKEVGGDPGKSHHRGREDINRRNVTRVDGNDDEEETEDDVKREPNRRISVTRSRRRILQPSGYNQQLQSSQKSRKIPMDEGRHQPQSLQQQKQQQQLPMDNALHTGLSLRDLEMRAWRDGGGKGGGKKGIPPGNPTKQQLFLLHQQQQQQQQQHQHYQQQQHQQRNSNGNTACIPNENSQIILHRPPAPQQSSHPRLSPDSVHQFAALRDEVALIREEHFAIRESLFRKEGELDLTRSALENIAEERDFLRKKVYELELLLKQPPKKFAQFMPLAQDVPALPMTAEEPFTCKVAERVKLKQIGGSGPSTTHSTPTKRNNNHHHRQQQQPQEQKQHQQQYNSNNNNSDPESPCSNNDCPQQEQQHHHHHHQHTHQSIHVNMNSVVQVQGKKNSNHSSNKLSGNYISGQELVAIGNSCSTRLVEHLVQPLQDDSTVSELEQAFAKSPSGSVAEEKVREFEIETERLNSRLEHLRCQNDVLTLNLDEAKSHADRLTVLLGKYESNNVGHQIALGLSDQLIEAYDVLVALLESELGLLLANCRAAGIGASTNTSSATSGNNNDGSRGPEDDFDVASLLHRASENRMTAEIAARNILVRMVDSPGSENNNGMMLHLPLPHPSSSHNPATSSSSLPPWEDASSCSQTLSSASSVGDSSSHSHHGGSSAGEPGRGRTSRSASTEKNEEQRVRDLIIQLKTDREAVRNTLVEMENWSLEPQSPMQPNLSACDILEARKLDLETAVLMQELMAMREDRAELRAQLFLLEKDKGSLESKLSSYEAQQDAYKARMNHLKAELAELQENATTTTSEMMTGREITETGNGNLNENGGEKNTNEEEEKKESNGNNNNNSNKANNNPTEREMILKRRLQELASSLEKVSHNANLREHQSHETVNELKKANNILLENLDSVKRKYQNRIRKMEEQIVAIVERHSVQMKLYKERVHLLEAEMIERSQHL